MIIIGSIKPVCLKNIINKYNTLMIEDKTKSDDYTRLKFKIQKELREWIYKNDD